MHSIHFYPTLKITPKVVELLLLLLALAGGYSLDWAESATCDRVACMATNQKLNKKLESRKYGIRHDDNLSIYEIGG